MSFIGRTFTEANPPERVVLGSVSNLCTAVRRSSSVGLVCNCLFSVSVRRDVFMYLFGNCGKRSAVSRERSKMYSRSDFSVRFFCLSDFVFYNRNEGVCVFFSQFICI